MRGGTGSIQISRKVLTLSINAHGLRSDDRINKFLRSAAKSKYDIILLQEHHLDDNHAFSAAHSAALYGFVAFFSADPSGGPTGGVANLYRSATFSERYEDYQHFVITPGRAMVTLATSFPPVINVHAPNERRPEFFDQLRQSLLHLSHSEELDLQESFMGGDFNCVPNTRDDYRAANHHAEEGYDNSGAVQLLLVVQLLDLYDVYRATYPEGHLYTWGLDSRLRPKVRLDRWYTPNLNDIQISPGQDATTWISDHIGVTLSLTPLKTKKWGREVAKRRVDIKIIHAPDVKQGIQESFLATSRQTRYWEKTARRSPNSLSTPSTRDPS